MGEYRIWWELGRLSNPHLETLEVVRSLGLGEAAVDTKQDAEHHLQKLHTKNNHISSFIIVKYQEFYNSQI